MVVPLPLVKDKLSELNESLGLDPPMGSIY